jgi:hypothetical protein
MANGRGRDERREAQWRRVVRGQRQSGLTIREFCRKSNLPESAFYFWRRELERRQAEQKQPQRRRRPSALEGATTPPAFVPVHVTDETPTPMAAPIEIVLTGGLRVHVVSPVDRQALADVLAVLRFDELIAPSHVEGEGQPC